MYRWLIFVFLLQQPDESANVAEDMCLLGQTGIEELSWGAVPEDIPKQLNIFRCAAPDKEKNFYVVKCIMNRYVLMDTVLFFLFEERGKLCSLAGCRFKLGLIAKQVTLAFVTPEETSDYFGDVVVATHGMPIEVIEEKDLLYARYPEEKRMAVSFRAKILEVEPYVLRIRYLLTLSFYSDKYESYLRSLLIAQGGDYVTREDTSFN
jgi:hypothetical protein